MRRLFLSVLVAGGLSFLAACSGQGGYGFSSGTTTNATIDRVNFQNGSGGYLGTYFVSPIVSVPSPACGTFGNCIPVTAIGAKGSQNVVTTDPSFTWSWAFAGPPATYASIQGNTQVVQKTCPVPAQTPGGPSPLIMPNVLNNGNIGGTVFGGAVSSPVAYDGRYINTIYVAPVPLVPAPYCLNIVATNPSGVQGSVVVIVTNNPAQ